MLNVVYFYISTFESMCLVPSEAVFCSFLMLRIPGMLFRHFLSDFEIVPVDCFGCHHPSFSPSLSVCFD